MTYQECRKWARPIAEAVCILADKTLYWKERALEAEAALASVDTHPQGGNSPQSEVPFMGSAVAATSGETPTTSPETLSPKEPQQ